MLFSVSFFKFVVLLFPLWVAAVSIVILLTARVPEGQAAPVNDRGARGVEAAAQHRYATASIRDSLPG